MLPARHAVAVMTLFAAFASLPAHSQSASGPIKIGLMLPYSGTYAALGNAIENGFKLYVQEQGGKLAGRELQYFKVDDESEPSKATDNVNKLIKRDNVDVLVGTVHSGVAFGDGQGGEGQQHPAHRSERRRRHDHRADVRREHRAQLVLELAAGLRDGRGRGAEGRQANDDDHLGTTPRAPSRRRASPRASRRAVARSSRI